ncbi:MAG TPA: hypothetical protein VJ246_00565 [Patescibacteria group bacterium]|nr:hypothetical protein [Patescibacteria group bacterium]
MSTIEGQIRIELKAVTKDQNVRGKMIELLQDPAWEQHSSTSLLLRLLRGETVSSEDIKADQINARALLQQIRSQAESTLGRWMMHDDLKTAHHSRH